MAGNTARKAGNQESCPENEILEGKYRPIAIPGVIDYPALETGFTSKAQGA
jgi:hypothetical protein